MIMRMAPMAIAVNRYRCQPPCAARKLNAAPLLEARTILKKEVMERDCPCDRSCVIVILVSWSNRMTIAAMPSHGVMLLEEEGRFVGAGGGGGGGGEGGL